MDARQYCMVALIVEREESCVNLVYSSESSGSRARRLAPGTPAVTICMMTLCQCHPSLRTRAACIFVCNWDDGQPTQSSLVDYYGDGRI